MLMESLDGRRLMYSVKPTGADPSFGDGGQVTFQRGFTQQGPIATAADGSIFVGGEIGVSAPYDYSAPPAVPFVVKLTRSGQIDTTFGDKGYARLPFRDHRLVNDPDEPSASEQEFNFDQMAYDSANGLLYVASSTRLGYEGRVTLNVTRLTADGSVNRKHGTDGTVSYSLPLPSGTTGPTEVTADALNPTPDGSVIVAMDRQSRDNGKATDQDLALMRIGGRGRIDPGYGRHGITQLLSGTVGDAKVSDNQRFTRTIRRAFFNDVRTDAAGVTRVTLRYEDGTAAGNFADSTQQDEATTGTLQIKARTITAAGVEDQTKSYAWTLFSNTDIDAHQRLVTYAAPDGNRYRALVASRPSAGQASVLYTLTPGQRVRSQVLALTSGLALTALVRSRNGQYLGFNDKHAVRLNDDFTLDRTFGSTGIADEGKTLFQNAGFIGPRFVESGVLADDDGGLLVTGGFAFQRFA